MKLGLVIFGIWNLGLFYFAIRESKRKHFYSDTPFLCWQGIFVWGDALVLAPFWFISTGLFWFLSPLNVLRYCLIFFFVRAFFETIFWIQHQFSQKTYLPPLFRRLDWVGTQEAAILYQLLNTGLIILCAMGLLLTFL